MKIKNKHKKNIYAIAFIIIFWQIISLLINRPILPRPIEVLMHLVNIFFSKILVHALFSMGRVIVGISLSFIIGMPLGIIMGYSNYWDEILSPIIYFIYPIPKVALLPVVMLIFGLGETSKIIMIMLIVVFQIVVTARDSVKNIPRETYYSLYSLGASKYDIFKNIILPAVLPEIITSVRIGTGTAISVLFFTETYGTEYGMGYFIMDSWMRVNYVEMYSGIIIMSLIGFVFFLTLDLLERFFCLWKQ